MPRKILILGGTKDAREIANALVEIGHQVTTSLAGVTSNPLHPDGQVRVGGFGGAEGLLRYLAQETFELIIDATHPYAARISGNLNRVLEKHPIRHLRLQRPQWQTVTGDDWLEVSDCLAGAEILPPGARVLVTIGRKEIAPYIARADVSGFVRCIEPPDVPLKSNWTLILERPQNNANVEADILRTHSITHLVTKNAGGLSTYGKIEAARQMRIPVIMIARPVKTGGEVFDSAEQLIKAVGRSPGLAT